MRKKAILEQLAALKDKRTAEERRLQLAAASNDPVKPEEVKALHGMDDEIMALEAELQSLEELEARAKKNAELEAKREPKVEVGKDNAVDKPWEHFGAFMQAVAFAGMPGRQTDPRLYKFAPSGASAGVPSDGGFLIQEDFSTMLLSLSHETGMLASRCRDVTIGPNSNGVKLPIIDETSRATGSRWGGVRVYRRNEAETVAATKVKLARLEISLEDLMAISYATNEMLEDATLMGSIIPQAFAEEFAYVIDDEIYNADGAAKCLGILNSPCLVTVSKESGQAADTIMYENIVKMFARMPARNARNAVWIINQDVTPQLALMKITDSNLSWPVFLPPGGASVAPYGTLMGRPIIPIEQAPTIGDVGDIMFADLSQYLLVKKGGLKADTSMHVRFLYDEMTFRWTYRINGQPAWKAAKTPAKGSAALSPFVVLEAR